MQLITKMYVIINVNNFECARVCRRTLQHYTDSFLVVLCRSFLVMMSFTSSKGIHEWIWKVSRVYSFLFYLWHTFTSWLCRCCCPFAGFPYLLFDSSKEYIKHQDLLLRATTFHIVDVDRVVLGGFLFCAIIINPDTIYHFVASCLIYGHMSFRYSFWLECFINPVPMFV